MTLPLVPLPCLHAHPAYPPTFVRKENYPKNLESVTPEWISVLLRAKIKSMSIKKKLEAGVTGDAAMCVSLA